MSRANCEVSGRGVTSVTNCHVSRGHEGAQSWHLAPAPPSEVWPGEDSGGQHGDNENRTSSSAHAIGFEASYVILDLTLSYL